MTDVQEAMNRAREALSKISNVKLLYPSNYLGGHDLGGKEWTLTIESLDPRHKLRQKDNTFEEKPVLRFKGASKLMVLNKTNAERIAKLYGDELLDWIGKPVTLMTEKVYAFGKNHDALRIKEVIPEQPSKDAAEFDDVGPEPMSDADSEEYK